MLVKKKSLTKEDLILYNQQLLDENLLFERNAIGQMVVNKDRVIVRVNAKFSKLFGYESEEIIGSQTSLLTPSLEKFYEYEKYFHQTKDGVIKSEELEYKRKDGELFWVKLEGNPINLENSELLILWSFIDITKEVHYREELKLLAYTDAMTKLYNRRYFTTLAQSLINLDERESQPTSFMMIDIDFFKKINDKYGHSVGDSVIIKVAEILQTHLRASDIASRWGGEEFLLLLPKTTLEGATNVAQTIRKFVEDFEMTKEKFSFTLSIGVSQKNMTDTLSEAIDKADKALYVAKQRGRNRVEVFDEVI